MWRAPPGWPRLPWLLAGCLAASVGATQQVNVKVCAGFTAGGFPDDCCTTEAIGLAFGKMAWERQYAGSTPRVNITYDYVNTDVDPGRAITCAFTGWHQEKAALILGADWSLLSLPVAQLGATIGGAQLDFGGTSDALSNPSYPLYVRTCVPDSDLASGMAQLLVLPELYNYSRLGIMYEPDDWGSGLLNRLVLELQHIRPSVYLKQVPLLANDGPGVLAGLRERLRNFRHSTLRIFVVLGQRSATLGVLSEAEFTKYITGPGLFLFGPGDVEVGFVTLDESERRNFMGLQLMAPSRSAGAQALRASWERMWLNMSLEDLPEPVSTWAGCFGGPLSAKPDCWWGGSAFFQSADAFQGAYFAWAFDASWLLHTAVQDLVDRGVAGDDIRGELLVAALINSSATTAGIDGPIRLTAKGDRITTHCSLTYFNDRGAKVQFGEYDTVSRAFNMTRSPVFADGSTVRPDDSFPPCPPGYFRDDTACEPAPPGTFSPEGTLTAPVACPAGSAAPSQGQAQCALCGAGSFGGAPGLTGCSGCEPGTYAERAGQSACAPCGLGYRANATGRAECELCPRGQYAENAGARACAACPPLTSTRDVGSRSAAQCECVEGYFRDGGGCAKPPFGVLCPFGSHSVADCICDAGYFGALGKCQACTQGMLCSLSGMSAPMQAAGYVVRLASGDTGAGTAAFSAYACYSELQCPEGQAGSCAPGRLGLACGRCQDGYYRSSGGSCAACRAGDRAPMFVLIVTCMLAGFPLYWYACPDVTRRSMSVLTLTIVVGQLIFAIQALGVFAGLRVRWAEPMASLLRTVQVVQLNFDVLKWQCLLGGDDPLTRFVGEMLLFPALSAYLAAVAGLLHLARLRASSWKQYVNVEGVVVLLLHIPLTLAVMRPFYCVANPNGTQHVFSHPDILCWRSREHQVFVALAVLGILAYPAVNIAMVTGVTWRYAALLSTDSGLKVLEKYQFLFDRFAPHRYYYGLAYFWRGMLLPIIPVLLPESGVGQVTFVMFLLIVCLCTVVQLQPWASPMGNVTETVILVGVMCLVHVSAFLVCDSQASVKDIGLFLLLVVVAITIFALAVIVVCLYQWLTRTGQYAAFLCHHKREAGALARFFKMHLREVTHRDVFLDADNLQELAILFDIVRTKIRAMVALLTRYTLDRMWCAGELTTTVRNNVPLVLLACEDFLPLTELEIANFGKQWPSEQRATLARAGMPLEAIRDAYRHIVGLDAVRLNRLGSREEHLDAVRAVAQRCGLQSRVSEVRTDSSGQLAAPNADDLATDIIVVACSTHAEARCVSFILSERLQVALRAPVRPAFSADDARPMARSAKYLLVVLTSGLFESTTFIELLLITHQDIELITVLADTSFQFPAGRYLKELEGAHGDNGKEVVARVKRLVNRLALPYSALGSEALLNTQVGELVARVQMRGDHAQRASRCGRECWDAASAGRGLDSEVASVQSSCSAAVPMPGAAEPSGAVVSLDVEVVLTRRSVRSGIN